MRRAGPWEEEAENWVRWVRTPGHDIYPQYREGFFDEIVPPPSGRTVEIGCGEGRVTRDLRDRGHRVVSVDLSPTLLRHARAAEGGGAFVRADAAELPIAPASCATAVAYNSLMDIADMAGAVAEVGRVLAPGGSFCISVVHPFADAGTFEGDGPDRRYVVERPYFGRRPFEATETRGGLTMRFSGWSYDIEHYTRALERAGLVIEVLREPVPREGAVATERWRMLPLFLQLRAKKLHGPMEEPWR